MTDDRNEVMTDEYGFAYRLDEAAYRPSDPHTIPTFDRDGYPSDETLDRIERWTVAQQRVPFGSRSASLDGVRKCLDFVVEAWDTRYGSVHRTLIDIEQAFLAPTANETFIRFATGGWSGNESLIHALQRNWMVHGLTWVMSRRGGLHIYRYE